MTDWICNQERMNRTKDALYIHPMPVDRGKEVTDEVASGPNSIIVDIAENRLHTQKAIMAMTIAGMKVEYLINWRQYGKQKKKLVVIALGGNAIKQAKEKGTAEEQFKNVATTCDQLVKMNALGYKLIITHGNGPQAGNLLIQQEEGKNLVPPMPLDIVGAMTQGQIGYMFQNTLQNYFMQKGKKIPITSVVTQVLVKEDDPDFKDPSKPVGPFYTKVKL